MSEEDKDTDISSDGCVGVPESLLKRHQERNERLMRKKQADVDGQANQAYLELFNQQFRQKQREIENQLKKASIAADSEKCEIFHEISSDINLLHRHLASASNLLTQYDLKKLKETVSALERNVSQAQLTLIPKKKFSFKKKQDKSSVDGIQKNNAEDIQIIRDDVNRFSFTGPGFYDRENERLSLCEEDVNGREVTISNLQGCTVIIKGCPSSVFIRSITNTTLILGPVATSVLLYGATESTVTAWCHQMRIHDSTNSDFYIKVATDPIIENCRKVGFAPYSFTYPGIDRDIKSSGLDVNSDRWNNVQDFDWLVLSHPSPYWFIIPPELRCTHWPD